LAALPAEPDAFLGEAFALAADFGAVLGAGLDFAEDLRRADEREAIFQSVMFKTVQDT
jgi:hypothetical protein